MIIKVIIESPLTSKSKYFEKHRESNTFKLVTSEQTNPYLNVPISAEASNRSAMARKRDQTSQTILSFNPRVQLTIERNFVETLELKEKKHQIHKNSNNNNNSYDKKNIGRVKLIALGEMNPF